MVRKLSLFVFNLIVLLLVSAPRTLAATITEIPSAGCFIGDGGALSFGCLGVILVNVVGLAFTFLGVATILYLLYGVIKFILSQGEQKAVGQAKGTITSAIIGFVVVGCSFLILRIITQLLGLQDRFNPFDFSFYQSGL